MVGFQRSARISTKRKDFNEAQGFQRSARTSKMDSRIKFIVNMIAVAFFVAGCFGGEESLRRADGYTAAAPTGWASYDRGESDRAFKLPTGSVVTVTSSCNRNADAPLETLTRHLLIGSRDVSIVERERISVAGTQGLLTKAKATLNKVPFNLNLFVLSKNDCVFDFTMVNKKPFTAEESAQFVSFIRSFHYGKD